MKDALTPDGETDLNHDPSRPCEHSLAEQRALAIQALAEHPNFRALVMRQAIRLESTGDKLVLNGYVPSFYHKQLLQETLRRVAGVVAIENRVAVVYPSGLPQE